MAVTIKDIAAAARVSKPTVSRVLGGKYANIGISEVCAERVKSVAKQMGYRPNMAARAISTGRFNNVALVMGTSPWRSALPPSLLTVIHDTLAAKNIHMTVARLGDEKLTDDLYVPRILRAWMCDGMLLNYTSAVPARLDVLLTEFNLPHIWMNRKAQHDCVHPDDFAASLEATRRLLKLGHRRIAYVDMGLEAARQGNALHYSKTDRLAGYEHAMKQAGLEPHVVTDVGCQNSDEQRFERLRQMVLGADVPTGAIAYGDEIHDLERLAWMSGRRVPQDISLLTFRAANTTSAKLRTAAMVVPDKEVGRLSVEMLLDKVARPSDVLPVRAVPFDYEDGYSLSVLTAK